MPHGKIHLRYILYVRGINLDKDYLNSLIDKLLKNDISKDQFVTHLTGIFSDEFKFDTNRKLRLGFHEFIFGESKTIQQLIEIISSLEKNRIPFICTKLSDEKIDVISKKFPEVEAIPEAGMVRYFFTPPSPKKGEVAIITAGSSDIPIAKEAMFTLDSCGIKSKIFADVGVAGVHRFFNIKDQLYTYDILIVVAGMEGALPSLVAGLFPQPIIAVPTSIGYGTALNGFTALFAMLTSCANGVTVVNINNGFGAAMAAFRILQNKYREDTDV